MDTDLFGGGGLEKVQETGGVEIEQQLVQDEVGGEQEQLSEDYSSDEEFLDSDEEVQLEEEDVFEILYDSNEDPLFMVGGGDEVNESQVVVPEEVTKRQPCTCSQLGGHSSLCSALEVCTCSSLSK